MAAYYNGRVRRFSLAAAGLLLALAVTLVSGEPKTDARLRKASRAPARNGWVQVHLEGSPSEVGFQHGFLLAPEIQDSVKDIATELQHDEREDWEHFRRIAREVFWPHVEREYRDEIEGIAAGVQARGVKLDVWDLVAANAWLEIPYYDHWQKPGTSPSGALDHCSAFVATGSYTRDGKFVIGHNSWTSYSAGSRWNIVFDVQPASGNHFLMDGMAGLIHSGDDFGINSAGLAITETTISTFRGFDPEGIPEFVRARKALQYAGSIDDFARIMKDGNNGGYANTWLVADRNTNEIASLELGLKHVTLERTRDGFFVGSNFPSNPELIADEADFDVHDRSRGENARHERWLALMAQNKGKVDVAAGQRFLADHVDSFEGNQTPSERTLCGHLDLTGRTIAGWMRAHAPAGAVQNKVTDAAGTAQMALWGAMGHACGTNFKAAEYLEANPQFDWYRPILRDLPSQPWTRFAAAK